ncbi:MAG: ABC transporter permease [Phycisphaerae bacterium]|nr:ABC transporter permease [Phycisphaerae bacterium]
MSDLSIVLKSLLSRRISSSITVLSVALAVALLLVLLSLRNAAAGSLLRGSGNAHLLLSADATPLTAVLNGLYFAGAPPRALTLAKVEELRSQAPGEWWLAIQQGDSYRGFPTLAAEPAILERFQPVPGESWTVRDGRGFKRAEQGKPFEAVLGDAAARATGAKLGDRIALTHGSGSSREGAGHVHEEYAFEVVGILAPTSTAFDRIILVDLEASWILHAHDRREAAGELAPKDEHAHEDGDHAHDDEHAHDDHSHDHDHDHAHDHDHDHAHAPLTTAADLTDDDRLVTGLLLRLPTRPGADAPAMLPQVHDLFRRDTSITVAQPAQEVRRLVSIAGNVEGVFLAMSAAVLVSSAIAIMLALYDGMAARRRQIAILRVLGFSGARIAGMVITESALIGAIGSLVGVAIGVGGMVLGAEYLRTRVGLVIDASLDARATIVVAGAAVALAALAGVLPAAAAYRTAVWRSLRPLG